MAVVYAPRLARRGHWKNELVFVIFCNFLTKCMWDIKPYNSKYTSADNKVCYTCYLVLIRNIRVHHTCELVLKSAISSDECYHQQIAKYSTHMI